MKGFRPKRNGYKGQSSIGHSFTSWADPEHCKQCARIALIGLVVRSIGWPSRAGPLSGFGYEGLRRAPGEFFYPAPHLDSWDPPPALIMGYCRLCDVEGLCKFSLCHTVFKSVLRQNFSDHVYTSCALLFVLIVQKSLHLPPP